MATYLERDLRVQLQVGNLRDFERFLRACALRTSHWRDRTKEADFLFHRAGRFRIADAKWTESPSSSGKLSLVGKEIPGDPPAAIFARAANPYPLPNGTQVLPLSEIASFLD